MNTKHGFGDGWKRTTRPVKHTDESMMNDLFEMHQDIDREIVFHDTTPLPEEELPKAREKAYHQKQLVLDYFRQRFSMSFTPAEVWKNMDTPMLITSVRRAITNLTKEGKLIKCDYSELREGMYKGHPNRTWKYNRNFINPITPKK